MVRRALVVGSLALAAAACFAWPHPGHGPSHGERQRQRARQAPPQASCSPLPDGAPTDLKTAPGGPDAPVIDAPVLCGAGEGYIKVHGRGTRRFVMGPDGAARGCQAPPAHVDDPAECPEVFADAFAARVHARLAGQGVVDRGYGIGACGAQGPDYDAWNYAITIHDWRQADLAVAAVAAELDAWGVGHVFGVAVRGEECVYID